MDGLTLAISAGALIVALISAYFGYGQLLPQKRQLTVSVQPPVTLLGQVAPAAGAVEVFVDGERVDARSSLVVVNVQNTGRFDVAPTHFATNAGLVIEFGARVSKVLSVEAEPEAGIKPECSPYATGVTIHPGIIARGQTLVVQLLAEGDLALPIKTSSDLVDVDVTVADQAKPLRRKQAVRGAAAFAITGAAVIIGAAAAVSSLLLGPSVSIDPDFVQPGQQVEVTGKGFEPYAIIEATFGPASGGATEDFGTVQANSDGDFTLLAEVPEETEGGPYEVDVTAEGHGGYEYATGDVDVEKTD